MEELEQKHLHLLQVVESEKTAKWQYTQHCEELTEEIKKLRTEVSYHSPEIRGFCQSFYFYKKKTRVVFFIFHFEQLYLFQEEMKVARNEKRKKNYVGFHIIKI